LHFGSRLFRCVEATPFELPEGALDRSIDLFFDVIEPVVLGSQNVQGSFDDLIDVLVRA